MINLNNELQNYYPDLLNIIVSLSENTPEIRSDIGLINSFRQLNHEDSIKEFERLYLSFAEVKDSKGQMIEFDFLNKWMERELSIFKNVIETSSNNSGDRILLLIGSDHLWMLRKLFEGIGWDVVNPFP